MIIQKENYQVTPITKIVIAEKQQKTILNFSLVSLNLKIFLEKDSKDLCIIMNI